MSDLVTFSHWLFRVHVVTANAFVICVADVLLGYLCCFFVRLSTKQSAPGHLSLLGPTRTIHCPPLAPLRGQQQQSGRQQLQALLSIRRW